MKRRRNWRIIIIIIIILKSLRFKTDSLLKHLHGDPKFRSTVIYVTNLDEDWKTKDYNNLISFCFL